jgi:hypothetical protein
MGNEITMFGVEHAPLTREQLQWPLGTEVLFEIPSHTPFFLVVSPPPKSLIVHQRKTDNMLN